MGFFEDKLGALGRAMDAGAALVAERSRNLADRRRHAQSFDAIRDRVGEAKRAARDKAERAGDAARERWSRHDIDAASARRAAAWLGVIALALLLGLGLRAMTASAPRPPTQAELDAVRALRDGPAVQEHDIHPAFRTQRPRP